jgi:tetratricopeptide (TPR) repeat protein
LCTGRARANEFEQFQKARSAYEALDYELAADLFEQLVGSDPPRLEDPALVIESRKYLAASYLFLGRLEPAEREFERLLRAEPDYILDPLAFPDELQRLFGRVKARLADERAVAAKVHAETTQRDEAAKSEARRREQIRTLVKLARTERVQRVQSRWVAMIPFGVGQFQNDDNGLGVGLAVSEGLLLSVGVATFLLHENLRGQRPSEADRSDAELAETAFRYANQISMVLFGIVAVAGVIHAQIEFDESRTVERHRELPPELEELQITILPTGFGVSGAF